MKFEDVREKILEKLKDLKERKIDENATLVEGFVNQSLTKKSDELTIGGPSVPMIMLVGNDTGRVYLFALKALDIK